MGKYEPLREYLAGRPGDEEPMTFSQVERLVGPLPYSAHEHRAWWANDNKSQALAWRAAGWHVASVNQSSGHVVFARGVKGGGSSSASQRAQPMKGSYIDALVIAAIKAQEGTDRFDRSKLLRLIDELNDNHGRADGYAVHALLRAILDHVPPLLGSADDGTFLMAHKEASSMAQATGRPSMAETECKVSLRKHSRALR